MERIEGEFIAGHLTIAQEGAENAIRLFESDTAWEPAFKVELAKIYLFQGESKKVVDLLSPPFPDGATTKSLVHQKLFLALSKARLGDRKAAVAEFKAAVALRPQDEDAADVDGTQGSMLLIEGKQDEAKVFFNAALTREHGKALLFHESTMLLNLGVADLQLEHYEDAQRYLLRALDLSRQIGAHQLEMKALGSLGWAYFQTGDSYRAGTYVEDASKQAELLGATIDRVYLLTNAGKSEAAAHDLLAARSSFEQALALSMNLQNPALLLASHVDLAYVLIPIDGVGAESHIQEAKRLALVGEDRSEDLEALLLEALLRKQQGRTGEAEVLLLSLVKQATASPSFQWEAETTLATLYASTHQPVPADYWFQRALQAFHTQRLTLQSLELQLPFLENGTGLYGRYVDFLIAQNRPADALRVLDASRAETLAEGLGQTPTRGPAATSPQALAARLGGTILVYSLQPERSYLWAIDSHRLQLYTLPGSGTILPLIARHNAAILASKDLLAKPDSTGRALYDALLAPAQAMLPHGGPVILLPGDGLSRLNFDTLIPPGPDPHYWVEDATLTNARSLRLLAAQPAIASKPANTMLLLGDPVYRAAEYPALPNAAAEMTRIAAYFPQRATVLSGVRATPAAYTAANPGQFGYLHVTAHATARETTPLDSAVILSHPSANEPEKLYAADILKQPLHAELVTLSSCYGTGTRNYTGEGLVGLVWAFLRAGAHKVIGAQWEVSDAAAPQFMESLYTRLLAGSPPDAALRAAKLDLIHQGGVFRKPLYWAAFQLYAGR